MVRCFKQDTVLAVHAGSFSSVDAEERRVKRAEVLLEEMGSRDESLSPIIRSE